jgi:redox-regulated HSP33 family molecular chaperone
MQKMPGTDDASLKRDFEDIVNSAQIKALENNFSLEAVSSLFTTSQQEQTEVQFQCTCTRESVWEFLKTQHKDEIQDVKKQGYSIGCKMCNEMYKFSEKELVDLLKEKSKPKPKLGVLE